VQRRALVTGITGQDGRHMSQFLTEKGYQVFGLVRGQNNPKTKLVNLTFPASRVFRFASDSRTTTPAAPTENAFRIASCRWFWVTVSGRLKMAMAPLAGVPEALRICSSPLIFVARKNETTKSRPNSHL
jgi:hypothetical protein